MPRRKPSTNPPRTATTPRPSREPTSAEDSAGGEAAWVPILGEWLRRIALGLTAALITARAYWPSELDLKGEAGSGLVWSLAMLVVTGVAIGAALVGGSLRLRWSWADLAVIALMLLVGLSAGHAVGRRVAINLAWEWAAVGLAYLLVRNLPRKRVESSILAAAMVATAVAVSVYGLYQVSVELPMLRA